MLCYDYKKKNNNQFSDQLNEIKKVKLSSIICEVIDVNQITPDAFSVKSRRHVYHVFVAFLVVRIVYNKT
jgi:hypothetical protein